MSEAAIFVHGRGAVLATLNKVSISGRVSADVDQADNFRAAVLDRDGNLIGEVSLDRSSWNTLKRR